LRPLSFEDFSGGISDKNVPGETNRYEACDNLFIDADKRLIQREGFNIYSSTAYQLDASVRVAKLANFKNDTEILAFQNKKAFAIAAGAWTEVTGPGGGSATTKAFNTDNAAKLLDAENWNGHLFCASSDGDPVIKMYRDSGNTIRLRSAGMPEVPDTLTPTDGGLALAIALANDIRTQMIAHFGSNGATAGTVETVSTKAHVTHADLTTQASSASATTAATNLSSLITLVNSLRGLYSDHIGDAQKQLPVILTSTSAHRSYHVAPAAVTDYYRLHAPPNNAAVQREYPWFHFLNFTLNDRTYTIPSSAAIADVLPLLNDLRDKWNWHNYSTLTHYNAWRYRGSESYTQLGVHATSLARVEPYTWATISTPIAPLSQYLQDIKTEFDYHRTGGMHHQSDTVNAIPSGIDSSPDDMWECITLLGWLAHSIYLHSGDAFRPTYRLTCDSTSGSAVLATAEAAPATNDLKDYWCLPAIGPTNLSLNYTLMPRGTSYRCTSNVAATSITCANNFGQTVAAGEFYFTAAQWHLGGPNGGTSVAGALDDHLTLNDIDFSFPSAAELNSLADFADHVADLLYDHETALTSVLTSGEISSQGEFVTYKGNPYAKRFSTTRSTYPIIPDTGVDALPVHVHISSQPTDGNGFGALFFPVSAANGSGFKETHFTDKKPEAGSFNYKMLFRYDYTVGTKSFTDRGKPSTAINVLGFMNQDSSEGNFTEIGRFATSFSNIYAFANAANENWDTADTTNFKKELYRTLASGQNYYRIDADGNGGSINNATTTGSDVTSDTYLVDQLALYTNAGAPGNSRPPTGTTSVHVFKNVMYYVVGNKVYQSIPNDLDSVPATFYEEFEEDIACVSSTKTTAVALGATKAYRLIGGFDDLGRGSLTFEGIPGSVGAISKAAVVKIDDGIIFAGREGFYATDGFRCFPITDLQDTFTGYTDTAAKRARIAGTYDHISKRVYFTVQTAAGSHPDKVWVLDLQFGIQPYKVPVTTLTKTSGFNPTALVFFDGALYYGDGDGYVWGMVNGRNIDLVKDTGVAATSWAAEAIRWRFKSCHSHYGSPRIRKYFTSIGVQFEQQDTNVSCQITSDADKGRIESELPVIRSRKLVDWEGDSNGKLSWVPTTYPAKAGDLIDEWRWFKGDGSLRSNFRAIELELAYCVIVKSDDMGTVTVANIAGNVYSVTLTSLSATRKWPLYSVGYYVRLNSVDYPVTVRTSDTVVRIDATGLTAPSQTIHTSWEMWGYPKNERARLLGYTVNVDEGGDNETASKGSVVSGGRNA
jgi:hypothetical protein